MLKEFFSKNKKALIAFYLIILLFSVFKTYETEIMDSPINKLRASYDTAHNYYTKKDYDKAVIILKDLDAKNYILATEELGTMYKNGVGVEKDISKAVELYTKACNNNSSSSCTELGNLYFGGLDIGKNIPKAVELYTKAYECQTKC